MSLSLITPPAAEPVTADEARLHLRVDTGDEDALITTLITAARMRAEWYTGRALMTQSWVLWRDSLPAAGIIEIPLPPLNSVQSVTLYGEDDTARVLSTALYRVDVTSVPGRVAWKNTFSPTASLRPINAIAVNFTAGYGNAAAVPAAVRQAILCIVADLYQHRGDEDDIVGLQAQSLLAPYRVLR